MRRMRSCAAAFVFAILLAPAFANAQAKSPAGDWTGAIEVPDAPIEIRVTLGNSDGTWHGTIDIPAQGAKGLPLGAISVEGRQVAFAIDKVPGNASFRGELDEAGTSITGDFEQMSRGRTRFRLKAAAAVSFDGVEAWLDDLRGRFHVPGCAIAIVKGGELVAAIASGERDVDKKLPVTPDTLFPIGSSTKAFTTLLLGTLVDEGRLEWDKPVRTWIPEFALADADAGEHLTPRDLVTHRSGMPRHDLAWYGATFERSDMVRRLRWLPLNKDLRTDFQYNNLMYLTAGHLAERVAGGTWEALVRQRILEPLGMRRSNFSVAETAADPDHAEPYRRDEQVRKRIAFRDLGCIGPAGSINSSVREMAHWVSLQLRGGKHGERSIVQPSTLADLHRVRMPLPEGRTPSPELVPVGYALGWFTDVYRGARRIQHGGNIDGFSGLVSFLPDRNHGFVVLTNLDGTPLPEMIVRRLCDRVLGLPDKDWASEVLKRIGNTEAEEVEAKRNEAGERKQGTQPAHALADYAGAYEHRGYGPCTVTLAGGRLRIDFHGLGAPLEHWHYEVFRCGKEEANPEIDGLRIQFTTDLDGDVDGLRAVLDPNAELIAFARQPDAELRDPAFLQRLAGEYDLAGMVVTFAVQGDKLTAKLPGQFHVLQPRRALVFGFGSLSGYSVRFVLDPDGRPVAAVFRQPNGAHEAKRKATD
jgi:CubicO group peptidase (beta-lactamase class C family)